MYKVRYYLSGGTLVSKTFNSLHDATMHVVYKVGFGQTYSMDLIKE